MARRNEGGRTRAAATFEDLDETMKECIENCEESNRACLRAVAYAMREGTEENAHHIRFFLDAADLSRLHVNLMLRESEFHPRVAELCAEVCERCAEECDELEGEPFEACATACREAAETCREMSQESVGHQAETEEQETVGRQRVGRRHVRPRSGRGGKVRARA